MASVGGAAALAGGLLILDPQLRRHAQSLANGEPSGELIGLNARAQSVIFGTVDVLKDYSFDNSLLVMFAVAALVLVVIMLRS
jgi:hypothetical protein